MTTQGSTASRKKTPPSRHQSRAFVSVQTRWSDNDVYGHVNNVMYFSFFDTAVNQHMISKSALNIHDGEVIAIVVENQCQYFSSIAFPDRVTVGLKVIHLGNSSVRYELAIFRNDDEHASAVGEFVHVYVDRASHRPVPIPPLARAVLGELMEA